LLVRRSLDAKPEYTFYFTYAPKKKSALKTLVAVAGRRWAVEIAFQMARASAVCITTKFATGRAGTGTLLCPCWLWLFWRCCVPERKIFGQQGFPQCTGNPAFARPLAVARLARSGASSALVGLAQTALLLRPLIIATRRHNRRLPF